MAGLGGQGGVDGEVIDLRQHLSDAANKLNSKFTRPLGSKKGIKADHPHIEGPSPAGNRLPDSAHSHDSERLARKLNPHELPPIPTMLTQAGIGGGHIAGKGQNQCKCMLGRTDGIAGGGVHHHDALPGRRLLVDIVGTNTGPHDGPQPLVPSEHFCRDLHTTAADRAIMLR